MQNKFPHLSTSTHQTLVDLTIKTRIELFKTKIKTIEMSKIQDVDFEAPHATRIHHYSFDNFSKILNIQTAAKTAIIKNYYDMTPITKPFKHEKESILLEVNDKRTMQIIPFQKTILAKPVLLSISQNGYTPELLTDEVNEDLDRLANMCTVLETELKGITELTEQDRLEAKFIITTDTIMAPLDLSEYDHIHL
jgi:hypothetical protein